MSTVNIFVFIEGTGITFANCKKGPKDKELTTDVKCGDKVKWKIRSEGLIITGIPMKDGAPNIWSPGKEPAKKSINWVGTICETAAGKTAAYSVEFTINGGAVQEQDPGIKVDPKG
jgi:hypothetical protein